MNLQTWYLVSVTVLFFMSSVYFGVLIYTHVKGQ